MRFRILPVALITVGVGLLLGKLGIVPPDVLRELVHSWWPLLLIALGGAMLAMPRGACGHRRPCGASADEVRRQPDSTA
jgi:hypothetical protein